MLLLSRFWYLFLAVLAAAALGTALLGQGIINAKSDLNTKELLLRDWTQLEATMRHESRTRLDRIAFITIDKKTGAILQKAGHIEEPNELRELNAELKQILHGHIMRMAEAVPGKGTIEEKRERVAPDITIAVDIKGRIIAQLGPLMMNPPGSGLGTYPLVKRAIQGYLRDDVWVYDRRVYRMTARPVIYGDQYVGAILHGYRYDSNFVKTCAQSVKGASVAFFYGTDVLASYSPSERENAPSQQQMEKPLAEIIESEKFRKDASTDPISIEGNGLAIYSRVVGSAGELGVGYVIARPKEHITTPIEMYKSASKQDTTSLPKMPLIGTALGLFAIGLLFLFLERDRPFRQLLKKTEEIARKQRDRLIITEWRGAYRKLADTINRAIDKEVEQAAELAPTRKKVNLDEILGPTPDAGDASAFFGFADELDPTTDSVDQLEPPPPPTFEAPSNSPSVEALDSPKAPRPPKPPPKRKRSAPAAEASPTVPPQPKSATQSDKNSNLDEDTHFKEVFSQYLATRKQCGESIDQLTYEKFLVTLRKNRDQIISKHGAAGVRFTVYVKQGKAALKAAPIKR